MRKSKELAIIGIFSMALFAFLNEDIRCWIFWEPEEERGRNGTFLLTVNHDHGRLGNKMFKYASLLGIAKKQGKQAFVLPYTNDLNMENVFLLTYVQHRSQYRIERWEKIQEQDYARLDPTFENLPETNIQLVGYLNSYKYFQDIQEVIRREFTPTFHLRMKARQILMDIKKHYPESDNLTFVGVHVRRTDEKSLPNTTVASKSYFINAFHKMRTLLPSKRPVFVVASNDLPWCQENLAQLRDTYILPPSSAEVHFTVLVSCKHAVITVGSYSWWVGWLTGGHVVFFAQFPWINAYEAIGFYREDYYPPSWIPVDE